jgi:hypothetical protein
MAEVPIQSLGNSDPVANGETAIGTDDEKRLRSSIVFPYNDLKEAISVAEAIWEHTGGSSCELADLAAWMNHETVDSGAFRMKVNAARIFGLTAAEPGKVTLTTLGRRIVDPAKADGAKAEAFLQVPLYQAIFTNYRGSLLPNNVGLERAVVELGVSEKQKDKARQTFQRSAQQAGFFSQGNNRLVRPDSPMRDEKPPELLEKPKGGGGGGDETPPTQMHPFVRGLVDTLPKPGTVWADGAQDEWLQAAKAIFKLIYKRDPNETQAN